MSDLKVQGGFAQGLGVVLVSLIACAPAWASNYYVARGGSDAGPGTLEKPWGTIKASVNKLSAGDTLNIRGGTYFETAITVSKSDITIRNHPGETTVLSGAIESLAAPGTWIRDTRYPDINLYYSKAVFPGVTTRKACVQRPGQDPLQLYTYGEVSKHDPATPAWDRITSKTQCWSYYQGPGTHWGTQAPDGQPHYFVRLDPLNPVEGVNVDQIGELNPNNIPVYIFKDEGTLFVGDNCRNVRLEGLHLRHADRPITGTWPGCTFKDLQVKGFYLGALMSPAMGITFDGCTFDGCFGKWFTRGKLHSRACGVALFDCPGSVFKNGRIARVNDGLWPGVYGKVLNNVFDGVLDDGIEWNGRIQGCEVAYNKFFGAGVNYRGSVPPYPLAQRWTKTRSGWEQSPQTRFEVTVPAGSSGTLRLFFWDNTAARIQDVAVAGQTIKRVSNFGEPGVWVEFPFTAKQTAEGKLAVRLTQAGLYGAVISAIEVVSERGGVSLPGELKLQVGCGAGLPAATGGAIWAASVDAVPVRKAGYDYALSYGETDTQWVHHNILDNRFSPQVAHIGDGPFYWEYPHQLPTHTEKGEFFGGFKFYNNSLFMHPKSAGAALIGKRNPSDPGMHEVYNNIIVWPQAFPMYYASIMTDGLQIMDRNIYYRTRDGINGILALYTALVPGGSFQTLADLRASPAWALTKAHYPPGWDAGSFQVTDDTFLVDPNNPNVSTRDYSPVPGGIAAGGALDLSSKGWPGTAGVTYIGALPAHGAKPNPVVQFTARPMSLALPYRVHFDGSASSSNPGAITDYSWDFGDGASVSGADKAIADHVYDRPGPLTVRLTVTNSRSEFNTAWRKLAVPPYTGELGSQCIVHWRYDNPSEPGHDSGLAGLHGIPQNAAAIYADPVRGNALKLSSATADWMRYDTSRLDIPDSFAYAFWFKTTAKAAAGVFCGTNGSPYFFINLGADGTVTFGGRSSAPDMPFASCASPTGGYNDGAWHHVACVRDAGARKMYLYIDGKLANQVADARPGPFTLSGTILFGRDNSGSGSFNGSIDDFRIYNGPLTQNDVAGLFAGQ